MRQEQCRRGKEAVQMFASFLEKTYGSCNGLSINEKDYSSGSWGKPDVIFREMGIEVKRVELLAKNLFNGREKYYAHLNNLSILHESWDWMKEWCKNNGKIPMLIVVMTVGRQEPLFIMFSQDQIDALQLKQQHKKWFQLNSWELLLTGKIINHNGFMLQSSYME